LASDDTIVASLVGNDPGSHFDRQLGYVGC